MNYETIIYQKADNIARITLNRPEVLNAINRQVMAELLRAIGEASRDNDVRVLILTGAERAFCAGGDFKYLGAIAGTEEPEAAAETGGESFPEGIILGLRRMDKPVIAMVNGPAAGMGCDLIFHCDIIIASEEKAGFGWIYIHRGIIADTAGAYFLSKLAGKHIALEILWRGDYIDARQMYEWNLINHVVGDAELKTFTYDLANKLATGSPPMIMGAIKYVVHKGLDDYINSLDDYMEQIVEPATRSYAMSEDAKEGMKAFLEKRAPVYKFK